MRFIARALRRFALLFDPQRPITVTIKPDVSLVAAAVKQEMLTQSRRNGEAF